MNVTVDKAGRIVVPKSIRDRYHLHPCAVLELKPESGGILLSVEAPGSALTKKQGVLIHHGEEVVDLDIVKFRIEGF